MKKKKQLILIMGILLLTGCTSNKDKLVEYLKEEKYEESKNCYRKEFENDDSKEILKFCLEDCKIYASDLTLDDYFVLDLKTKYMQYSSDYMMYQSNLKRENDICMFQGEEIDLESSYCKTAKIAFERQLSRIQEEANKANVNLKHICK